MGRYRTRPGGRSYSSVVSYAPAPTPLPPMPGFGQRIKQVGAPIGVIIALALVTGLIITGLLLSNPVGAMIGLVLSSVAIGIVVLCYLLAGSLGTGALPAPCAGIRLGRIACRRRVDRP